MRSHATGFNSCRVHTKPGFPPVVGEWYHKIMPRSHIGRFMSGRRGLRNVFKRNRKLRRALNQKERGHALKTLARFKKGRGITVRGGPGIRSELDRAYGKWRRDTKDPISKAQAKLIKRELEKYGRGLQQVTSAATPIISAPTPALTLARTRTAFSAAIVTIAPASCMADPILTTTSPMVPATIMPATWMICAASMITLLPNIQMMTTSLTVTPPDSLDMNL